MKFCSSLSLLLLKSIINSAAALVALSPSPAAPVCREGDQLELACNTISGTTIEHRWEFIVFPENVTHKTSPVTALGMSGIPRPLTIGTSTFTFSRLSGPNVLSLVSMIIINPVNRDLNGTVVSCIDDMDSVATTTILIVDSRQFGLSIRKGSEDFSSNDVTVTVEWTLLKSQLYYLQLLHNVSVSADPPLSNVIFIGNMRAQLTLSYNILHNVSVTQHSTCQQLIRTQFLLLNYNKCHDPMELTDALAVGYVDPALEGQNITYACPPGQILNGSNTFTCMWNGKWEPDPREVECTGASVSTTVPTMILLEITTTSAVLRTALISVTCILVVLSLFIFIAGAVFGHYLSKRCKESANRCEQSESHNPTNKESDLELKDNIAYIPIHPIM